MYPFVQQLDMPDPSACAEAMLPLHPPNEPLPSPASGDGEVALQREDADPVLPGVIQTLSPAFVVAWRISSGSTLAGTVRPLRSAIFRIASGSADSRGCEIVTPSTFTRGPAVDAEHGEICQQRRGHPVTKVEQDDSLTSR